MKTSSYSSLIKEHFASIAKHYTEAAFISKEVSSRLINRLQWMKIQPQIILDVGCGNSESSTQLKNCFPNADVIGVDLTYEMLKLSKEKQPQVCANAYTLPFRPSMADIVYANFLLPWCELSLSLFLEFKRILKPSGLLLFSTLGPDSLKEASTSFTFVDMHSIGDLLVEAGLQETVMDVEHITLQYQNTAQIIPELINQGFGYFANNKIQLNSSVTDLTFEVIYGHAWKPLPASISIKDLKRIKR
jgi:malonyl-CoA O-methyltransferase